MRPIIGDDGEFIQDVPISVSKQALKRAAADRVLYRKRARGTGYDPDTVAPVMGRLMVLMVVGTSAAIVLFVTIFALVSITAQLFYY